MKPDNWKQFRPFYVYPPLAALLLAYTLTHNIYGVALTALLLVLGLIEWAFLEYVLHRFSFHLNTRSPRLRALMQKNHMAHHSDTRDMTHMFVPVLFGLSLSALSIWLRTLVIWPWQGAVIVTVGIWTGYLWYEFVHYTAHIGHPRSRLLRYLKIYHLEHHFQNDQLRFGVTSPVIDRIFGTYRPIGSHELPPQVS